MSTTKKILLCLLVTALTLSGLAFTPSSAAAANPKVTVLSYVPDVSVTIQITGFSTGYVEVRMAAASASYANWIKVGTFKFIKNDTLVKTVSIPNKLKGKRDLLIRVLGSNGLLARTAFTNKPTFPVDPERPHLVVTGYVYNKTVTVAGVKLAPGVVYTVWIGSARDNRYSRAGTITSPTGLTVSATFNLPLRMVDNTNVYLLLQDPSIPCSLIVVRSPCVTVTSYRNVK